MNFKKFIETVENNIRDYLPMEYQDAEIDVIENQKLNETYTGLVIHRVGERLSPTINLNRFFEQYDVSDQATFFYVMNRIADMIQEPPVDLEVDQFLDYEAMKSQLFIRISRVEGNESLMEEIPYRKIEDLVMTYHLAFGVNETGTSTAMITNRLMQEFQITPEQLHEDALRNSPKIFPEKIEPLGTMMKRMLAEDMSREGMSDEEIRHMIDSMDMGVPMPLVVVTNEHTINGAAVLFYPELMDQLGEMLDGDYFILPSSVHEVLLLPDDGLHSAKELKELVSEVNATTVEPEDRLTNEVYHYDTKERVFEKAHAFEQRQKMNTRTEMERPHRKQQRSSDLSL